MKTTIKLFTLTAMITLFFTVSTSTSTAQINFFDDDEAYINDIPFNTEMIAGEVLNDQTEYLFDDEPYIDDIPFDTHAIFYDIYFDRELKAKYAYEDESYIDDIPFDTEAIYKQVLQRSTGFYLQSKTVHCDLTRQHTEINAQQTL